MQVERLLYRNIFICNPSVEADPFFIYLLKNYINNFKKYRTLINRKVKGLKRY
jgi:hypothetical protein